MCLLLIANNSHPNYKLIIGANRDEFYNRPTEQAHFWEDKLNILAGRDLQARGTWLGISETGKIAALTNFREGLKQKDNAPTRGLLTVNYLKDFLKPADYLSKIKSISNEYNGFNLVLGEIENLYYFSNKRNLVEKLETGVYGLSNGLLDSNWPKVLESRIKFQEIIKKTDLLTDDVFKILSDRSIVEDEFLPDTGIPKEIEKILSAVFIKTEKYGTRCSTVVMVDSSNKVQFVERTFNPENDKFSQVEYNFKLEKK